MPSIKKAILLNKADSVATALSQIQKGDVVDIIYNNETVNRLIALDDIEIYHKIAVVPIQSGNNVYKYGEVIGKAIKSIEIGQCVHIDNIESVRGKKWKLRHTKDQMANME